MFNMTYEAWEGGFGNTDPLMEHTDDRNDGDTTGPFQPGSVSTPGPSEQIPMRTTTMNRPPERGLHTAETSDNGISVTRGAKKRSNTISLSSVMIEHLRRPVASSNTFNVFVVNFLMEQYGSKPELKR